MKDFFGQIEGDGAELLLHGTRPPRGSLMVNFTHLIVADHSRSAQGRAHFINALGAPERVHLSRPCYTIMIEPMV